MKELWGKFCCRIGRHDYHRTGETVFSSKRMPRLMFRCKRCGKMVKWSFAGGGGIVED